MDQDKLTWTSYKSSYITNQEKTLEKTEEQWRMNNPETQAINNDSEINTLAELLIVSIWIAIDLTEMQNAL
jgi:hypothetical protein